MPILDDNTHEEHLPKHAWGLGFICVLTWLGSGTSLYMSINSAWWFIQLESAISETGVWHLWLEVLTGLLAAMRMVGAGLMWRLQQIGFWVYVSGCAGAFLRDVFLYSAGIAVYTYGSGIVIDAISFAFSLLFVAFYWQYWGVLRGGGA